MARNQNVSRENRHMIIVGQSGSGKSTFLRGKNSPLKNYRYVIVWDPDEDHGGHRYTSKSQFAKALKSAVLSGKQYRLCLTVEPSKDNFEFFCACVWQIADGNRDTAVVIEELADVTTQGKATYHAGQVMRKGRKYGLDVFPVTQRPAEIDKTTYSQCATVWVGFMKTNRDIKRIADDTALTESMVRSIEQYHYLIDRPAQREPERGKITI